MDFNWGDKPALMVQGRETFAIEGKENRAENLRGLDLWRNRLGVSGASEAERREDENKMLAVGQYPLSPYGSSRNKQVTEREPASPLSPATQREASDLHSKILCLKERIASQAALTTPLGSPPSSETDRGLDPDASLHSWGFLGQVSE